MIKLYVQNRNYLKQIVLFPTADAKISASPSVIVAHPDFRMVVLANRPGFPFLGNDFFGAMGQCD